MLPETMIIKGKRYVRVNNFDNGVAHYEPAQYNDSFDESDYYDSTDTDNWWDDGNWDDADFGFISPYGDI